MLHETVQDKDALIYELAFDGDNNKRVASVGFTGEWFPVISNREDPCCAPYDLVALNEQYFFLLGDSRPMSQVFAYGGRDNAIHLHSLPPAQGATLHTKHVGTEIFRVLVDIVNGNGFSHPSANPLYNSYVQTEHEVAHTTYRGRVITNPGEDLYPTLSHGDIGEPVFWLYRSITSDGLVDGFVTYHLNDVHAHSLGVYGELTSFFRANSGPVQGVQYFTYGTSQVSGLSISSDGLSWSYKCHVNMDFRGNEFDLVYDYKVRRVDYINPSNHIPSSGSSYDPFVGVYTELLYDVNVTSKYREIRAEDRGPWLPVPDGVPHGHYSGVRKTFRPFIHYGPAPSNTSSGFHGVRSTRLSDGTVSYVPEAAVWYFEHDTADLFPQLRVMNAVSGANALEHGFTTIKSNNLENLTQLASLREFISPIGILAKLLVDLKTGNWALAIKELLDLLSSVHLLYKYGICTTLRDAEEFVKHAKPTIEAIRSGDYFRPVTGQGKHTFNVPPYQGYSNMRVIAYTKIRFQLTASSILSVLVPAYAIGILPTISNLWDLLPWSFVVDWFTNIGGKAKVLDNHIMSLWFQISGSTSTIKVIVPIPPSILGANGCLPRVEPCLTRFSRAVEPSVPPITPSIFDVTPPAGGDIKIGLALAWQTISSSL